MRSDEIALLLNGAKESEKKYNWLDAAEVYWKASDWMLKEKECSKAAEFYKRTGFCYSLASRQANSLQEFKKLRQLAVKAYKRAAELFKEKNQGKSATCLAIAEYTLSWIASNAEEKKKILDKCRALGKEALEAFKKTGDELNYGKTCNVLLWCLHDRVDLTCTGVEVGKLLKKATENMNSIFSEAPDWVDTEVAREAISIADNAILVLSKLDQKDELLLTFSLASIISSYLAVFTGQDKERRDLADRCLGYLKEAVALYDAVSSPYFKAVALWAEAISNIYITRNFEFSLKTAKEMLQQASIVRDNYLLGNASSLVGFAMLHMLWRGDWQGDPDTEKQQEEELAKVAEDSIRYSQLVCQDRTIAGGYGGISGGMSSKLLRSFAFKPLDKARVLTLSKKAVKMGEKGLEHSIRSGSVFALRNSLTILSDAWYTRAKLESRKEDKLESLKTALSYEKESIKINWKNPNLWNRGVELFEAAQIETDLAILEEDEKSKSNLLRAAVYDMEEGIAYLKHWVEYETTPFLITFLARTEDKAGEMLTDRYFMTKDEENLTKANTAYKSAAKNFQKVDIPNRVAECYWKIAKNLDQIGEHRKAAENFKNAFAGYKAAAQKLPQLSNFYISYANYMKAWSEVETAKQAHKNEKYAIAMQHYEKTSRLLKQSKMWSYLAPNFTAWSILEQAEDLSRKEDTHEAIRAFKQALEQFTKAEKTIHNKIEEITETDEKEMATELIKASDLRREYCQARILLEDAKLLDREGKHLQSSKSYQEAAQNISAIVEKVDVEAERNELKYMAILCKAWGKMANAEETASSESYVAASELFEQAKEHCYTKKASLWALGNSSFCKGLAAGLRYKASMDIKENVLAKRYIKDAASSYLDAGFMTASEYAKATQRLFDAYAFMNQAENELNQEKRAKQYQMAENLLQIAAGSFVKARQPEKTAQVKKILANVREEKALAVSLSKVMQAPTIASSTLSFTAPTPTREISVGLKSFEHANVQANLVSTVSKIKVGESFCLSVEFVNVGREPALLTKVEDIIPSDFVVVEKPEISRLEDTTLNMKGKQLAPLKLVEAKLVLQPSKKGEYRIDPSVHYLDELGHYKSLQLKTLEIKVEEVVLGGRVSTGTRELDSLLLGGIPSEYAVALTGPPCDEREIIIKNFLKAGTKERQITFYVTSEAEGLENFLKQPNFYLFLGNPKPKVELPDVPNIFKLGSKTDLTNLSIALSKALRKLDQTSKRNRVCIEIVSDVLLRHKAEATRRWISELITDLGSKGFTLLVVINPLMHASEELHAVLDLFDGEISLTITKDPLECKTSIRVEKLRNQDYIKNPICLT